MANLTFTATNQATVKLKKVGQPFANSFTANSSAYTIGDTITIPANSSVTFVGSNNYLSKDGSNYYQFETSGGDLTLSGDLISLVNNSPVKMYSFFNLFKGCTNIVDISDLNFPNTIADWCYSNMFMDCTGLVNAGTTLPATTTTRWCYSGMFARCTSLTTPPTILADKLNPFCYYGMFTGCSSLVQGPELKYITVEGQFSNNIMFKDCTSLSTVKVNFTNQPTGNELRKWLDGVADNGVFVKPTALADSISTHIPNSWTLSSYVPPSITVNTIPTFSFDKNSQTDIVCSLLDPQYVTYIGDYTLNCSIEGTLPTGLSAVNGIITGTPSQFTNNFGPTNFNVVYSAQDVEQSVTSSVPIQIVNAVTDYSTLPLTYECIRGSNTLRMPLMKDNRYYNGSNASGNYSNWGGDDSPIVGMSARVLDKDNNPITVTVNGSQVSGWFDWKALDFADIPLTAGQRVELTGNSTYFSRGWNSWNNRFRYTGDPSSMIVYGNLSSVIDPSTSAINMQHVWYQGEFYSGYDVTGPQNQVLVDASKLVIPFAPMDSSAAWEGSWGFNFNLSATPLWTTPVYKSGMLDHALKYNTSLRYVELCLTGSTFPTFPNGPWMNGISQSGYFIKRSGMNNPVKSLSTIPSNWVILNRVHDTSSPDYGKLFYAEAAQGHQVGEEFTGDDPYSWYYQTHK